MTFGLSKTHKQRQVGFSPISVDSQYLDLSLFTIGI